MEDRTRGRKIENAEDGTVARTADGAVRTENGAVRFRTLPRFGFLCGCLLAVCIAVYALLYRVFRIDLYTCLTDFLTAHTTLGGMPCVFLTLTGFCCPGCGGTRATLALLHLHPIRSLLYHPLPLYGFALYVHYMVRYLFSRVVPAGCPIHLKPAKPRTLWLVLLAVLVLGNWVLRFILRWNGLPVMPTAAP